MLRSSSILGKNYVGAVHPSTSAYVLQFSPSKRFGFVGVLKMQDGKNAGLENDGPMWTGI